MPNLPPIIVSGLSISALGEEEAIRQQVEWWRRKDGDRYDYKPRPQESDVIILDRVLKVGA